MERVRRSKADSDVVCPSCVDRIHFCVCGVESMGGGTDEKTIAAVGGETKQRADGSAGRHCQPDT